MAFVFWRIRRFRLTRATGDVLSFLWSHARKAFGSKKVRPKGMLSFKPDAHLPKVETSWTSSTASLHRALNSFGTLDSSQIAHFEQKAFQNDLQKQAIHRFEGLTSPRWSSCCEERKASVPWASVELLASCGSCRRASGPPSAASRWELRLRRSSLAPMRPARARDRRNWTSPTNGYGLYSW